MKKIKQKAVRYGLNNGVANNFYFLIRLIIVALKHLYDRFYTQIIKRALGECGKSCKFQYGIELLKPSNIHVKDSVKIGRNVSIISENPDSEIYIGEKVYINKNTEIDYSGSVYIGDNVTVSEGVRIFTHTHGYNPRSQPKFKSLHISSNAWLGFECVILPNVKKIGKNSIIGARAVVTMDVEDNAIVSGSPALKIGER